MFPFAGFLRGMDIVARVETGQVSETEALRQSAVRSRVGARLARFLAAAQGGASPRGAADDAGVDVGDDLLRRALLHMAHGATSLVLVSLEDLLMQTEAQNQPGTGPERPNWRRRLRAGSAEVERVVETAAEWFSR